MLCGAGFLCKVPIVHNGTSRSVSPRLIFAVHDLGVDLHSTSYDLTVTMLFYNSLPDTTKRLITLSVSVSHNL